MKRLLRNLTYANVCATLALFVAVSTGGAYAASQIDGRTIKPKSIPSSALMDNAVTSAKIKNGQVTGSDVKAGSLAPTVFSKSTQEQINVATGKCPDGRPADKCSLVDVVPTGAGQPCRFIEGGMIGVWVDWNGQGYWLCKYENAGVTMTVGPALAGKYSGAVNA